MALDLSRENDPEVLRQAALLLEAENRRLIARVTELTKKLIAAQGKDAQELQLELQKLEQQLQRTNKILYGQSSEKRGRGKDAHEGGEKKPQTGHGPREQIALALLEVEHDLDDADKVCTSCGGGLEPMKDQYEESEEISVVERHFVLKKHRRKKYTCACGGCIETAPAPKKLVAGARYSIDFAVHVGVAKYLDHMPLERQVRAMARDGLIVDSQTLYDQLDALAKHLRGAYERLGHAMRAQPVVFADETPWPVYGKNESAKGSKWHAWTLATPNGVYYEIHDSRSTDAGRSLLSSYQGTVVCDGYAVYDRLARELPKLRLAQCWAHARRKFIDVEGGFPKETEQIVAMIGELYEIERRGRDLSDGERLNLRRTESRAVLTRIQQWCVDVQCTPGSGLANAISYMSERWSRLCRFIDDAAIPLDNNAAERALRGVVVGRKNHYGSRSRRGSEVSALFYSLLESAKLVEINPAAYLRAAVDAALDGREVPLPHEIAARA